MVYLFLMEASTHTSYFLLFRVGGGVFIFILYLNKADHKHKASLRGTGNQIWFPQSQVSGNSGVMKISTPNAFDKHQSLLKFCS